MVTWDTTVTADVTIIGGGPAGLAAGIAARRKGLRVIVVDACQPPIDKACGEGLMPDALEAAAGLGITFPLQHAFAFRGIRFASREAQVASIFPNGNALGIRRTILHESLIQQAASAGVDMLWNSPVTGIDGDVVKLAGQSIRSRWIVGADGSASRVRHWAGLDSASRETRRYGFRRHYRVAPWTDFMEIYWSRNCQLYVTPIASDEVCVAVISRDRHVRVETALAHVPQLAERLAGAPASTNERGAVTITRRLRSVFRRNVALIGDASGSVDAITGEGLCLAFRQARALADAFVSGNLNQYQAEHRRIQRRPEFMADFMLLLDRWPNLQNRVIRVLSAQPHIFRSMLAMHVGQIGPVGFAASGAALGWHLLAGTKN